MYGANPARPYGIQDIIDILTDDKVRYRNEMSWILYFDPNGNEKFESIDNDVKEFLEKHGYHNHY